MQAFSLANSGKHDKPDFTKRLGASGAGQLSAFPAGLEI
jgi:hypothetical protein